MFFLGTVTHTTGRPGVKIMAVDRKDRELIRKRRNNLLRRHDEFARRYQIRICLTIEMPTGRLYTYRSNPDLPAPTEKEIVSRLLFPGEPRLNDPPAGAPASSGTENPGRL